MKFNEFIEPLKGWVNDHGIELVVSLVVIVLFLISRKVIRRLVLRHAQKNNFEKSRVLYVSKITGFVNVLIFSMFLGITWEVSLSGLSFYFASIFTVVGVALFAHWSILSNVTASVILYFFFPYKIGSKIRIQDGENSVEGLVIDIKMFYMDIELEDSRRASYPNNLAIQKASISLK